MPETETSTPTPAVQGTLLTYAVLTGLTPLIPIPFVDDLAKDFFRRRLVRTLAASRGITLAPGVVENVTSEPAGCLLSGCLTQVVLYPLKKIFRKIFYFLEWKRSLDLTSQTYHFGFLVDCALRDGFLAPAEGASPEVVREAIATVCREAPIRPVESAVAGTFRQSRATLKATVGSLERLFRQVTGRPGSAQVEATLGPAEEKEKRQVAGVVENLRGRMQTVPESHFHTLREQLRARLQG